MACCIIRTKSVNTRQQSSDRRLLQAIQYERSEASESITKKYLYER
jgi:hypothetical protein